MSYQLNASDLAVALQRAGAKSELRTFEAACVAAAEALERRLGVDAVTDAGEHGLTQDGFGGLCIPFYARTPGQPLPDEFEGLDSADEWSTREEFESAMSELTGKFAP